MYSKASGRISDWLVLVWKQGKGVRPPHRTPRGRARQVSSGAPTLDTINLKPAKICTDASPASLDTIEGSTDGGPQTPTSPPPPARTVENRLVTEPPPEGKFGPLPTPTEARNSPGREGLSPEKAFD